MPEGCPAAMTLAAFSEGSLPDREAHALEAHLGECLVCARKLEALTAAHLQGLGLDPLTAPDPTLDGAASVQALIEQARSGRWEEASDAEAAVLSLLEPSDCPEARGRFAGYDILDVAGRGGMGVVLKAQDPTLHRPVALKVLSPALARDAVAADRFLREARTLASLHHDYVVGVHAAGRERGLPYLVMPFYPAGTLERWLAQTPRLTVADVARIGGQLARALEATHARGVLHRDLKPSNVLLEDGVRRVRLADFGLAQPVDGGASGPRLLVAGTPHYMSPEQARGEPVDARSDLYGLGALLYHLATGHPPHRGDSVDDVLRSAAAGRPIPVRDARSHLPRGLTTILDRLLAPRPSDRFATAAAAATALERLSQRLAGQRRRRGLRIGMAVAASLVAGLTVGLLGRSGRTSLYNAVLCRVTGHGFSIQGQYGSFEHLDDVVSAAPSGSVVDLRYTGERVARACRLQGKALTLRAASGHRPTLLAANGPDPIILADGPLAIEGVTLMNRESASPAQLVLVEGAPLHLLNCRLVRVAESPESLLIRGGRRVPPEDDLMVHRPLVVVRSGGAVFLENCLVLGTKVTGVGMRGAAARPIRVQADNSLFVVHRSFVCRPETGVRIALGSDRSVFVTGTLLDLDNAGALGGLQAQWHSGVVDRDDGVLFRWSRGAGLSWQDLFRWTETDMVHAGAGPFARDRRGRRIEALAEWQTLCHNDPNTCHTAPRGAFTHARSRSARQLEATDVDLDGLYAGTGLAPGFQPQHVGIGAAYARFRGLPDYADWRRRVQGAQADWQNARSLSKGALRLTPE